jgi:uncharacterized protein (DUF2164 family)
MNDKIFTFFATSGGLIVGWTLNELAGYFKSYRENRKILQQILYSQIEIRDVILKTNINEIESQIQSIIQKELPAEDNTEAHEIFAKIFSTFIKSELNNRYNSNIKSLIAEYESRIAALAQIDPFTTYAISRKEVALDYLGYIDGYLKNLEGQLLMPVLSDDHKPEDDNATPENFVMLFNRLRNSMTPLIRESALETIEVDIHLIAKKAGFFTLYKTKEFLNKTCYVGFDNNDLKKLQLYIQSIKQSER